MKKYTEVFNELMVIFIDNFDVNRLDAQEVVDLMQLIFANEFIVPEIGILDFESGTKTIVNYSVSKDELNRMVVTETSKCIWLELGDAPLANVMSDEETVLKIIVPNVIGDYINSSETERVNMLSAIDSISNEVCSIYVELKDILNV